ncbi:MAG: flagellar basal-body rod protein FlgF [Deltaproteobacteria bacterium]|nr:flagellar basal-body rod protein FlgF [Deltaproteobacteria bacterium]
MNAAVYKVLSGAIVQMRRLEAASQDLANLNTSGYKREGLTFNEILADFSGRGQRAGGLVAVGEQRADLSQGALQRTENPFDLAIEGDGFFVVQTPRGLRYTRQGTFTRSIDGKVVTPSGYPLMGDDGAVRIDGKLMEVTPEGTVLSDGVEAARFRLVRLTASQLRREGQNLFQISGEVQPGSGVRVIQGALEQSNVNGVERMVTLIAIQRQFEALQRALRAMDALTERMITEGTKI